jgi:hypothetical protein
MMSSEHVGVQVLARTLSIVFDGLRPGAVQEPSPPA